VQPAGPDDAVNLSICRARCDLAWRRGEDSDYGLRFVKWMNSLSGSSMWHTRQRIEALLESQENIRGWKSVDALFARPSWTCVWIWQRHWHRQTFWDQNKVLSMIYEANSNMNHRRLEKMLLFEKRLLL